MRKHELQELANIVASVGKRLQTAASKYQDDPASEIAWNAAFDNQSGKVVRWDGDLWFLNDDGDIMWPLGHNRCIRNVVADGNSDRGDITPQDLDDVGEVITALEESLARLNNL